MHPETRSPASGEMLEVIAQHKVPTVVVGAASPPVWSARA